MQIAHKSSEICDNGDRLYAVDRERPALAAFHPVNSCPFETHPSFPFRLPLRLMGRFCVGTYPRFFHLRRKPLWLSGQSTFEPAENDPLSSLFLGGVGRVWKEYVRRALITKICKFDRVRKNWITLRRFKQDRLLRTSKIFFVKPSLSSVPVHCFKNDPISYRCKLYYKRTNIYFSYSKRLKISNLLLPYTRSIQFGTELNRNYFIRPLMNNLTSFIEIELAIPKITISNIPGNISLQWALDSTRIRRCVLSLIRSV